MKIGIIDYGSGNLHSAHNAVRQAASIVCPGDEITRITLAPDLKSCDRIILPGVGHFADCYSGLFAIAGMIDTLNDVVRVQARPFLGICVGMQLLADKGSEGGTAVSGLGWIPGDVVHFSEGMKKQNLSGLKIPHMGWNHLSYISLITLFWRKCKPRCRFILYIVTYFSPLNHLIVWPQLHMA